MLQIKNILFPTDQSAGAEHAFAHATSLAAWHEAALHAVHVLDMQTYPPPLLDELRLSDEEIAEQLHLLWEEQGRARVEREADTPVLRARQVEASSAAEGILGYADEHDIDLIVMGTHGRRSVSRLMLGSVAEEVVRRAECPVMTVRAGSEAAPSRAVQRVLAPVDFFEFTHLAIDYAVELAQTYGARIDLLHVVDDVTFPELYGVESLTPAFKQAEERACQALEKLVHEDIGYEDVRVAVEVGHPAARIADYAAEHETDLVVIPTHGRSGLKRFLIGSVAEKVVRLAPCPVFAVKSFGKSLLPPTPRRVAQA